MPSTLSLVRALKKTAECSKWHEKIESALEQQQYALATVLYLSQHNQSTSLKHQQRLIRGLVTYHPRLTPLHLSALYKLNTRSGEKLVMESVDKTILLQSLMAFDDLSLLNHGLKFIMKAKGSPMHVSVMTDVARFAARHNSSHICILLWRYLQRFFHLTSSQYGALMYALTRVLANSPSHQSIAREIADSCLKQTSNNEVALSIARVAYKTEDLSLMQKLHSSPDFEESQATKNSDTLLKVALGTFEGELPELQGQDQASLVKHIAKTDLPKAEQLSTTTKNQNESSKVSLAYQYILNNDKPNFDRVLRTIESLDGIKLNLKLTWEQKHGEFKHAKRHYQNWQAVPIKQRRVALSILKSMAQTESELQWIKAAEHRLS